MVHDSRAAFNLFCRRAVKASTALETLLASLASDATELKDLANASRLPREFRDGRSAQAGSAVGHSLSTKTNLLKLNGIFQNEDELARLRSELREKTSTITELEHQLVSVII